MCCDGCIGSQKKKEREKERNKRNHENGIVELVTGATRISMVELLLLLLIKKRGLPTCMLFHLGRN